MHATLNELELSATAKSLLASYKHKEAIMNEEKAKSNNAEKQTSGSYIEHARRFSFLSPFIKHPQSKVNESTGTTLNEIDTQSDNCSIELKENNFTISSTNNDSANSLSDVGTSSDTIN